MDKNTAKQRARALLEQMSTEEKLHQLSSQMLYEVGEDYETKRDPLCGCYRNPGHFMHFDRERPASPAEVAARIGRDVENSIRLQPHAIPPLEHGEALHGAQWGMATVFPQPIGMASSFDPALMERVADVIGKECAAVGVRQALSPVVNLSRDARWGRTVETFGEDVLLASDMGAAFCRSLQANGVVATPKHFADNYADGGRDSNYSDRSERGMREVYLKPFEACIKQGGALGVMAAYNAWEGVPCHCNPRLLTGILREEWGFEGIVVSDYSAVYGVYDAHRLTGSYPAAIGRCIEAGMEIGLANMEYKDLRAAYDGGYLSDAALDRAVLRLLEVKFRIGLFDAPASRPAPDDIVRCAEHQALALEAARESMVLLKNDGLLPLKKENIKRLGVFGPGLHTIPVGDNYTGPYRRKWEAPDAETVWSYLKASLAGAVEVVTGPDSEIETLAAGCDAALYFTAILEGEGMDRSDLRLPGAARAAAKNDAALIVDAVEGFVAEDQEQAILAMARANRNAAVVLLGGAPVEMRTWHDAPAAILEAWYPGEQGARAIAELLFGAYAPSGKLPVTFPACVGQLPLYYAHKPTGRGYGYAENDGRPLYPFGYGLSYTSFRLENAGVRPTETGWTVFCDVVNTGDMDGAEVLQVYLSAACTEVVLPVKELKAYRRVFVERGKTARCEIPVPREAVWYYDAEMNYGPHAGRFTLHLGVSSEELPFSFPLSEA